MKLGTSILVGGISATGVAVAGSYYVLSSKAITIREALENKKFINSSDSDQWTEEFKSDAANIGSSIKELKGATEVDGGRRLKVWCESQMELDSKKNPNSLELVEKYCLIRDMASQLSRSGKTLLISSSPSGDWTATYNKRRDKQSIRADMGLTGTSWTENTDLPIIKGWCESNSKKEFLASNKNGIYSKLVSWCTKEAASEQ